MDNTRPVRTNTADRAPHTLLTQGYVRVLVCTVCSSVQHSYQPGTFQCTSSCNNRLRCRWVPSKNDKITSCLASDGQHAPRTHKHCRPCAIHANDTEARARTCLHGLFSVEHSYQPGTFQCTSSCNNRLRCRWIPQRTIKLHKK